MRTQSDSICQDMTENEIRCQSIEIFICVHNPHPVPLSHTHTHIHTNSIRGVSAFILSDQRDDRRGFPREREIERRIDLGEVAKGGIKSRGGEEESAVMPLPCPLLADLKT